MRVKKYIIRKQLFLGTYKNRFGSGQSYAPRRTVKKFDLEADAREFFSKLVGLDRHEIKYGPTVIAKR